MKFKIITLFITLQIQLICNGQVLFEDHFDGDLSQWILNSPKSIGIINSQNPAQGNVLELRANSNVSAIIGNSDKWGPVRVEGKMLFPKLEQNYLGFIYNYQKTTVREDFGLLYVKGNDSYIRANPWRDGNVSRLLYEEYKTNLEGTQAIEIGKWYPFKMEVADETCHLYIIDMDTPKITFNLFELSTGMIGFQPRVTGGSVWIDDIKVSAIQKLGYQGGEIPNFDYDPDALITNWEVYGPLPKPDLSLEQPKISGGTNEGAPQWKDFETDKRGAVITGRITEYQGANTVAYFRTTIESEKDKAITLHFTTTDELTLFLDGEDIGRVYRDGYVSKGNDWNAWYDFYKNPQHAGRKKRIFLKKGKNQLIIRVRNGQFASGGFFACVEK